MSLLSQLSLLIEAVIEMFSMDDTSLKVTATTLSLLQ